LKYKKLVLFFLVIFLVSCEDNFNKRNKYLITIRNIPDGSGSTILKSGFYDKNSELSIEAIPTDDYTFLEWTGSISGSTNPKKFILNNNFEVNANYSLNDEDGDGISDRLDQCPETKEQNHVDENGCCVEVNNVQFSKLTNLPQPAAYNSSASSGSYIYLSKGVIINSDNIIERTPNVYRYDINNDFWETFVSDALPVSYGASEIIGSNLYLFNGKNFPIVNDKVLNDTVEVINLNDRSIRRDIINPYPVVQSGSAVWNYTNIIFFGGRNLSGCSDNIVKYDIISNSFKIIGNIPFPICNAKGEVFGDKLYIVGGDLDYDSSDKVLIFNLITKEWEDEIILPMKISHHTTSIYEDKILIKGDFNMLNLFAVFDIESLSFRSIESNVIDSRYLTSQIVNGIFYVIGGNQTSNYSTMINNFQSLDLITKGYFCY
tara:strand:+ start:468 stop:1763 length:1296 start_codon:yes stop_codon:yes gene_type:complete